MLALYTDTHSTDDACGIYIEVIMTEKTETLLIKCWMLLTKK